MNDATICPSPGKSTKHSFVLRPVHCDLTITACPDGIVKFSSSSRKVTWYLPNWNLLVQDPTFYCGPNIFDPLGNIATNAFLGLFGTSIPEIFVNLFDRKQFEFRFKNGANFTTSLTCADEQEFATGTCTISRNVTVNITCCIDGFRKVEKVDHTFGGKSYNLRKVFYLHYRGLHNPPAPGSCIDAYLSVLGLSEKTHLMSKVGLRRKKAVWGLTYYRGAVARIIKAGIRGQFLTKGGSPVECNCATPISWDKHEQNSNWFWATYRENTPGLYRVDKTQTLKAEYYVEKRGEIWTGEIVKYPGSCSP